ncbi:TPA: ABC transporter ATP-binding protein, partial [Streptococcus equi subsp. equi]|nr:ABC transporter ATP-binding protein [Streptococcus equi subsp. equi]
IKLLNIQKWIQKIEQNTTLEFEDSRQKYQYRKDLASNTGMFLSFFSQVACMVAGIFFVRNNLLTVGLLVASIQLLNGVFGPLQSFLYNKNLIKSTGTILTSIQEVLDKT